MKIKSLYEVPELEIIELEYIDTLETSGENDWENIPGIDGGDEW